jgi:hypothetical protein
MQPLHAVPSHYFNVTPYGLDHLFQSFEQVRAGTFGDLEEIMEWIFRLVDAKERVGAERVAAVLDALRDINSALTNDERAQFAAAVFVEARKPHPSRG